jgi:hypothetical protein
MASLSDYSAAASDLGGLVDQLGVKKDDLQRIIAKGGTDTNAVLAALAALTGQVQARTAALTTTDVERQRKVAELQSQIQVLQLIDASSPDFDERMDAEREISRLTAILGTFQAVTTLRFDQLLTDDAHQLGDVLTQAAKDIAAQQDLTRVLKGAEVVLRAAAFAATVAAKLALPAS